MNSEIEKTTCQQDHHVFHLPISKHCRNKKKLFSENFLQIKEELGPGNPNWFQDVTIQKLQEKKKTTNNILSSPLSLISGSNLSPCSSNSTNNFTSENVTTPNLHDFLQSQTLTPTPLNKWIPPLLGDSPFMDDPLKMSQKSQASSTPMMKSLGIDPDQSQMSWTSSLATPTLNSPMIIGSHNLEDLQDKQKGLPRALFSPGPTSTDNDSFVCLDNTIEPDDSDKNCPKSPKVLENKHKETVEAVSSKTAVVKQENKNENVYHEFSMPLFSQDSPVSNTPDANIKKVKVKQEVELDYGIKQENQATVTETLADFFDPPSGSVGRRRCAPSRGKKRKSLENDAFDELINKCEKESPVFSSQVKAKCFSSKKKGKKENFVVSLNQNCSAEVNTNVEDRLFDSCQKVVKSILSSNKKQVKSKKKVRFSNGLETSNNNELVLKQEPTNEIKSEKSMLNPTLEDDNDGNDPTVSVRDKTLERKEKSLNEQCSFVAGGNEMSVTSCQIQSNLKANTENLCQVSPIKNLSHTMYRGERKSSGDSDHVDDLLFSQVSPSGLQEMCKVVTKVCDFEKQHTALQGDTCRKEIDICNSKSNGLDTATHLKCEITTNNGKPINSQKDEIVEVSKPQKRDHLKLSKKRKFLYPTSSQIAKSKPKILYGIGTSNESEQTKKEERRICSKNGSKITFSLTESGERDTGLAGKNNVEVKVDSSALKLEFEHKPQLKQCIKLPIDSEQTVPVINGEKRKTEQRNEEKTRERINSIQTIGSDNVKEEQRGEDVHVLCERNKTAHTIETNDMNQVCATSVPVKGISSVNNEEAMNNVNAIFQDENSNSKTSDIARSENSTEIMNLKNINPYFVGFASAKGSPVVFSEDSLKKAGALIEEVNKEYQVDEKVRNDITKLENSNKDCVGFVSAKGSHVAISGDAMKKANALFQEDNGDLFKAENKNEKKSSNSDEHEDFERSAKIKKVEDIENLNKDICSLRGPVSHRGPVNSIKRSRSLGEQSQDIDKRISLCPEISKFDTKNSAQKEIRKKVEFDQEHSGFSFASGQHVSLSSKSLKIAAKIFSESYDDSSVDYLDIKNSGDSSVYTNNEYDILGTKTERLDDTEVTQTCDKSENSEFKSEEQVTVSEFQKANNVDLKSVIKNSGDATLLDEKVLDNDTRHKGLEHGCLNQEEMDVGKVFIDDDEDNFIFSQDDQDLRLMDIDNLTENETKLDENRETGIKHGTHLIERKPETKLNESRETYLKHGAHLSERRSDKNECLSDVEIKHEVEVGDSLASGFKTASGKSFNLSDDKLKKAQLTFEGLDELFEDDGMADMSCETRNNRESAKFDCLQIKKRSAELNFKSALTSKNLNQDINENTKNNSEFLQSENNNFNKSKIVFQAARHTATDRPNIRMSKNDKGRLLASEFQKEFTNSVHEELEQIGKFSDKTSILKQSGHIHFEESRQKKEGDFKETRHLRLEESGSKMSRKEGDLNKATSLMSEFYNELYNNSDSFGLEVKHFFKSGFSTAGGKMMELSERTKKLDNSLNTEFSRGKPVDFPKSDERELEVTSGMGFSTAGGKNIEPKSVIKHPLISEFKELYNNTLLTDKAQGDQKELDVPLKGFTMASGKSLNLKDSNLSKAHSLISEFQNELCSDSDPLEQIISFKKAQNKKLTDESSKMLPKKSLDEKKSLTTFEKVHGTKFDSTVSAEIVPQTFDELSGIDNFDNVLKQLSAKKNQGFKIPQKSEKQIMKSSTISARFPPGSSVPKGFRPFKAPKVISKPKSSITSSIAPKNTTKQKIQKSELNVDVKCLNSKDSLSKQCVAGQGKESLNLNTGDGGKHLNDKDFDMDLDGSMINQMFADDLEASQKFSPKSGKPVKMDDNDVKDFEFNTDGHDEQNCVKHLEKCHKDINCVTHQTENSEVITKSQDSLEVKVKTEMQPVLSSRMSDGNGFQTASGKALVISDNSFSRALTLMNDTDIEFKMCGNTDKEIREEQKRASLKGETKDEYDSREKIHNSFKESKKFENTGDPIKTCSVLHKTMESFEDGQDFVTKSVISLHDYSTGKLPSFQTASGKNVNVSETALSKVRTLFHDNSDEDFKMSVTESDDHLTSESGSFKNMEFGEKKFINEKDSGTFYDQNKNLLGTKVLDDKKQIPCLVADQQKYSLSITHELEKEKSSSLFKMGSFQTASGKTLSVSEDALERIKSDDNNVFEDDFLDNIDGFDIKEDQIESNGPDNDQSLSRMQQQCQEVKSCRNSDSFTRSSFNTSNPFMTASGKCVSISQNAIDKAKSVLDGTDYTDSSPDGNSWPENSASNVESVKNISVGNSYNPFQTASGKKLGVSAQALQKARQQLNDSEIENGGIKNVEDLERVSEVEFKPMEMEDTLYDKNFSVHSSFIKPKIISEQIADKCFDDHDSVSGKPKSQMMSPFMSASGKSVSISESSLQQARQILDKDFEKDNSASKNSEFSLDQDSGCIRTAHDFMLPGNLSGQKAGSLACSSMESKDEIKGIRRNFSQNEDIKEITCSEYLRNLSSGSRDHISPFQSASGKNIVISKNALENARRTLDNDDAESCFSGEIISQDSVRRGNNQISVNKSDHKVKISPFQSAAGKSVSVSITALNKARESLGNGNTTQNCDTLQKGLQDHKPNGCKKEGTPNIGKIPNEEDFIVPDGLFDEMEPPLKRFKYDSEEKQIKDTTRHVRDGKTLIPCTVIPEGYSMDRKSTEVKMKPLQCHSLNRERSRAPVLSSENSENKTNSTVFKTPYKIHKTEALHCSELSHTSTKSPMPVFIPKSNKVMEVCSNSEIKVCEISSNRGTENLDLMSASEEHMEIVMCEQMDMERNAKNKIERIQEARHKQKEMIDNKKLCKIRQVTGRLLQLKMESERISLKDIIDIYSTRTSSSQTQLLATGVSRSVKNVRASNAFQFTFQLEDYYGNDVTHVYVGDGAYLVPRDDGTAGKEEFFNAFLTVDSVDPSLINEKWFENHYSLIVWKLAAYEVISPWHFVGRSLTPEMLLLQMKYRYDREVDRCHRSALKKILERDDSAGKRMVLCVCDIQHCHDNTIDEQITNSNKQSSQVSLEVTDGWYRVRVQLDTPLTQLVHKGHIKIGYKLCVSGAELIGTEDACSPLEAPSSVMLKFHMNSTRPVTWNTKLGYQDDPRPLCVPLTGLHSDGGLIGCLDVVLARKYPLMYMEKISEGVCIFRSEQAEEKAKQVYQNVLQDKMESLYRNLESKFESEEAEDKCISKKKWTTKEVEYLQTGQEIYEALSATHQSDILESYLSHHQMSLLMDYRRQLQDEKRQKLQAEFQKAWNDGEQNSTTRNVIPLIKFRVVGCAKKDLDNKASTIITVWRPTSEIMELEEGKRYKIFNLNASSARSKYIQNEVQLTATRQTRFKLLPIDENLLDILYDPREVSSVADIKKHLSVLGEVDFVGFVISVVKSECVESGKEQDIVYAANINSDILGIKFWTGVKAAGLEDVLGEGRIFCSCNLMDKSVYRSTVLPVVEFSGEFSHISHTARYSAQRKVVDLLKKTVLKNKTEFLREGKEKLDELLQRKRNSYLRKTPEKQHTITKSTDSDNSSTSTYQQSRTSTKAFDTHQSKSISLKEIPVEQGTSPIDCIRTPNSVSSTPSNQEQGASFLNDCTVTSKLVSPTHSGQEHSSTDENGKTPNRSLNQIKMSRLLSYGSPVPLSPLPTTLNNRKTNKAFKSPVLTNKPQ